MLADGGMFGDGYDDAAFAEGKVADIESRNDFREFCQTAGDLMCKQLSIRSRASDAISGADDYYGEGSRDCKTIYVLGKKDDSHAHALDCTCVAWTCTGSQVVAAFGRLDVRGFDETPGSVRVWNIFRRRMDPETPDIVLNCDTSVMSVTSPRVAELCDCRYVQRANKSVGLIPSRRPSRLVICYHRVCPPRARRQAAVGAQKDVVSQTRGQPRPRILPSFPRRGWSPSALEHRQAEKDDAPPRLPHRQAGGEGGARNICVSPRAARAEHGRIYRGRGGRADEQGLFRERWNGSGRHRRRSAKVLDCGSR